MSGYQEARRLFGEAAASRQAAQASGDGQRLAAADAALADATRNLRKFEVDPYARCARVLTGASA